MKNMKKAVKTVLEQYPETRNSDDELIKVLTGLDLRSFGITMGQLKTIERCRRWHQMKDASLSGLDTVRQHRQDLENTYKEEFKR